MKSARMVWLVSLSALWAWGSVRAEVPMLETVFPAGAVAGGKTVVEVTGKALAGLRKLHASWPGFECSVQDASHCEITIPKETPPGLYDVWALSDHGISSPRTFFIGHHPEVLEATANETLATAEPISLNSVMNGRLEQPGDLDCFRFEARQGQRVILECWAERIDSRLRAILEVFDAQGQRLAVNRGYFGIDPLIDFRVPADGIYFVKISDLVFSGSREHYYRLDIDTGPRVAFTVPNVIPRGQASRVTLFGWNLLPTPADKNGVSTRLDQLDVEIPAALAAETWPLPVRRLSHQSVGPSFAYHLPGSHAAVAIGLTDVPVLLDAADNHSPATAQRIPVPCEISGRLVAGEEWDWFSLEALRGEVFHFDVLSQRLGAMTDLQLSIWNDTGDEFLAEWNDDLTQRGGLAFPANHLDPAGRWVAPANGRFLILVRNLSGGLSQDARRSYRCSVRREEPDMQLAAVSRTPSPAGFQVPAGGRFAFDILANRQRGLNDTISVSATGLPAGIECPPIVLGPGVDRAIMIVSADAGVASHVLTLNLEGDAPSVGKRPVRGSTVVRTGQPLGWSRFTAEIPLMVTGSAPVQITAAIQNELHHPLYGPLRLRAAPGSVVDIAVTMVQRNAQHQPAMKLSGVGLPAGMASLSSLIPAGQQSGTISFSLPATLAVGQYSFAIAGETTVPTADGKSETVTVISNPLTLSVHPAGFRVDVDPSTPRRVQRGETFQIKYSAERLNGFIGKIHTELASPGVVTNVPGLRGRGVTFVGQSAQGDIQVVVNNDAPLGPQPFLRLLGVGVLEDQPTHFGAVMIPLEIVETASQ